MGPTAKHICGEWESTCVHASDTEVIKVHDNKDNMKTFLLMFNTDEFFHSAWYAAGFALWEMSIKLQERPFKLLQSWTWLRIALLLWAERKFTALKLNENETAVEESEEPFPFPQVTSDITWRFRKWIRTCPSCVATSGFFSRYVVSYMPLPHMIGC